MPIYEYSAKEDAEACDHCRPGFELLRSSSAAPLEKCPECGAPVVKLISPPTIGTSSSSLDDRARGAGFHKLKRLGKGEYEKQY